MNAEVWGPFVRALCLHLKKLRHLHSFCECYHSLQTKGKNELENGGETYLLVLGFYSCAAFIQSCFSDMRNWKCFQFIIPIFRVHTVTDIYNYFVSHTLAQSFLLHKSNCKKKVNFSSRSFPACIANLLVKFTWSFEIATCMVESKQESLVKETDSAIVAIEKYWGGPTDPFNPIQCSCLYISTLPPPYKKEGTELSFKLVMASLLFLTWKKINLIASSFMASLWQFGVN